MDQAQKLRAGLRIGLITRGFCHIRYSEFNGRWV